MGGVFLIVTFEIGTGVVEAVGVFIAFTNGMQDLSIGTSLVEALNKALSGSDPISFQLAHRCKNLLCFLRGNKGEESRWGAIL